MALLIKSINGLAYASIKSRNGLAVASIKSINGLDATGGGGTLTRITGTVAGATSSDTGAVTSSGINTTGANFIIISASLYTLTTADVTISDSKGNTWTALTGSTNSNFRNRLYYCVSPSVGSGHTFTATGAATFPTIAIEVWSAVSTSSPFDQQNGNANGSASLLTTGSITPTQANTLVFTGCTIGASRSFSSIDSSFTIGSNLADSSGNHVGGAIAYKQLSAIAAQNPQWSFSGTTACAARIANFKY